MQSIVLNAGLLMLFCVFGSLVGGLFTFGGLLFLGGFAIFWVMHYVLKLWDVIAKPIKTSKEDENENTT